MQTPEQEFLHYYNQNRCQHAPENPFRVIKLGISEGRKHAPRLSKYEILSMIYDVLQRLFRDFDGSKYHGQLSLDDHFLNLFGNNLRRAIWAHYKKERRISFNISKGRPCSGLWSREEAIVREAVGCLGELEQKIILGVYWGCYSNRQLGKKLHVDHKTIKKHHDQAIEKLRFILI